MSCLLRQSQSITSSVTLTRRVTVRSYSLDRTQSTSSSSILSPTPKPPSSLWFTARPSLNQTIESLDSTLTQSRAHLFRSGLLPSISAPLGADAEFADVLPHPRHRRWKDAKAMATYLRNGTDLRSSQYKKLTGLLSNLEGLLPYAELADALPNSGAPALVVDPVQIATSHSRTPAPSKRRTESALHPQLAELLRRFQQPQALSASGVAVDRIAGKDRRLGKKDAEGRVVAVGRRKESGARVWIVPVAQDAAAAEDAIPGRVLVNSLPLPAYFTLLPHRAAAIHPLSLTSTLGSFNVFAIAKGGGLAAQADAVAMGLSRALIEWERCEVEAGRLEEGQYGWRSVLKSAKLVERDPRMVERKKTGQLKARKKMAWVKR